MIGLGRRPDGESGQAIVIVALMMVLLIAFAGLAVDGGSLYLEQRGMQSAADLAAMAGAAQLPASGSTNAISIATANVAANVAANAPAANGPTGTAPTVVVNSPPVTGEFVGNRLAVQVQITRNVPTTFIRVLGINTVPIHVNAVAEAGTDSPPYAVIALSKTARPGIDFSGTADVYTQGAGIMSNSSDPISINHVSGGIVDIDGPVNAVGGIRGTIIASGDIVGGQPYFPDPFRDVPPPPIATLPVKWGSASDNNPGTLSVNASGQVVPVSARGSDDHHFAPGVYYGGIKILSGSYYFEPGIYVMAGGGLNMTGGDLHGSGVFVYNTVNGRGSRPGPISLVTTGTLQLSPPGTSLYAGLPPNMTFFQDRNLTSTTTKFNVEATGVSNVTGTIYVPTNNVKVMGGGTTGIVNGQVIADTIDFGGGAGINVNYNGDQIARKPGSRLVE